MKFSHIINIHNENNGISGGLICIGDYYINYEKKLGVHFGKELHTEREFGNFVDHHTVA